MLHEGGDQGGSEWISLKEIQKLLDVPYWRIQRAVSVLRMAGLLKATDIRRPQSDQRVIEVKRIHLETIRSAVFGDSSAQG